MKKLFLISFISVLSLQSFAQNIVLSKYTAKDYLTDKTSSSTIKQMLAKDYGKEIADELSPITDRFDWIAQTYRLNKTNGECIYQASDLPKIHSKEDEEQYEKDKQEWIAKCQKVRVIWDKKLLTLYKERLEKLVSFSDDKTRWLGFETYSRWLGFKALDNSEKKQVELVIKDLKEKGF